MEDGILGDKPKQVPLIPEAVLDPVGAQAVGIASIVLIDPEFVAVVAVQPILRAKPHEAMAVLDDAVDRALGEAVFDGEAPELDSLACRDVRDRHS